MDNLGGPYVWEENEHSFTKKSLEFGGATYGLRKGD